MRRTIAELQQSVPPGEPILAWIDTPFYLNYARNYIIDIQVCGLCDMQAALPPFRYAIWAYKGYATEDAADYQERALDPDVPGQRRAISARWLDLQRQLVRWRTAGRTLYDDGSIAVIRMAMPDGCHSVAATLVGCVSSLSRRMVRRIPCRASVRPCATFPNHKRAKNVIALLRLCRFLR